MGRPVEDLLHPTTHQQLQQTGKGIYYISNRKMFSTLPPQEEERRFPPCLAIAQPMRNWNKSDNRKPLDFKFSVFSNGFFVTALSNSLLFSIKERTKKYSSPLFSGLAYGFCHSLHVLNCKFLQFQKWIYFWLENIFFLRSTQRRQIE